MQRLSFDSAGLLRHAPDDSFWPVLLPYWSLLLAVLAQLSLTASVGVAHNKTLAKLASAAAKPDGLHVAISPADVQALLQRTPAKRLPQAGGKDSHAFARAGISCVADLQAKPVSASVARFLFLSADCIMPLLLCRSMCKR